MRAAVLEEIRKPLVVREVPEPKLEPHGVMLRVEANGICRSDWHTWVGDWDWIGYALALPWVIGHEFCGVEWSGAPLDLICRPAPLSAIHRGASYTSSRTATE